VRAKPRYPLPGFLRFSVARPLPPYLYRDSHKPFSIACAVRSRRKNAGAESVAAPARVRVANPRQGDFAKPDCVVELRASGRTRLRTTESRSENSEASRKLSSSQAGDDPPSLLQRDRSCYAYRLTPKGVQVALLFLFFHKRLCGPLANSRFHHCPDTQAGQQARSRLPSRRQSHSTDRRSPRRLTFARRLLNSFCLRFSGLESNLPRDPANSPTLSINLHTTRPTPDGNGLSAFLRRRLSSPRCGDQDEISNRGNRVSLRRRAAAASNESPNQ
jgi:hypothetical protein